MESNLNIRDFTSHLEKPSKKWYLGVGVLSFFVFIGIIAAILQIVKGQYITGMNDNVVWGFYEVNFIFFLGLSYSGALVSCIFQLAQIKWGKPMVRMLEMMTVFSLIISPIYILLCLGRIDRILHLIIYARIQSPIIWDFIAVVTDLFLCIAYLYFTHIKDFAKLRDCKELNVSPLKKKLYKMLSLNYQDTPSQQKNLNMALNIMASIIIPTSIIAYSLLAWLFGMNQRPGWHSSIFAPFFVLTAVYSGVALLIIIMYIYRKVYKLEKYITNEHFNILGFILINLSLFYGYFSFSEYITMWYNQDLISSELLSKLSSFSEFGWMTILSILFTSIIPLIIIGLPFFRSTKSIFISAILILIGFWYKRYLIIVPTLETPYLPIQDLRESFNHYSATWVEWSLTLAGISAFVLFFVLISKFVPIVSISDLEEKEHSFKFFFKTRS